MTTEQIVRAFHSKMTAGEMAAKYKGHISSYGKMAKKIGVKLVSARQRKSNPVDVDNKSGGKKFVKSANEKNPDVFKVKQVDYSTYDRVPVGEYNEEIYVLKTATPEEVRAAVEARKAKIKDHRDRNKITPMK